MNPRLVRGKTPRGLQLLNGFRVFAHFKMYSAEDVMSERQTGMQLDGLLRELQSRFGLFVPQADVRDLKPRQSVVRGIFDLFFESRDGRLVVALGEQITSVSVLHARRFRVIGGQTFIFLPGIALILLRRLMLGVTHAPDDLTVSVIGRYLRGKHRQTKRGQSMRDDQVFTIQVFIAQRAED